MVRVVPHEGCSDTEPAQLCCNGVRHDLGTEQRLVHTFFFLKKKTRTRTTSNALLEISTTSKNPRRDPRKNHRDTWRGPKEQRSRVQEKDEKLVCSSLQRTVQGSNPRLLLENDRTRKNEGPSHNDPEVVGARRACCGVLLPLWQSQRKGVTTDTCSLSPRGTPSFPPLHPKKPESTARDREASEGHGLSKVQHLLQKRTSESFGSRPEPDLLPERLTVPEPDQESFKILLNMATQRANC